MKDQKKKRMQQIEEQNRKAILEVLKKQDLTFGELMEKHLVSRATLTSHLKKLLRDHSVEKIYDNEKKRVVYHIKDKSIVKLQIESMIQCLGVVATYSVFTGDQEAVKEEIECYTKDLAKWEIPAKTYMEYLKKNYRLEI